MPIDKFDQREQKVDTQYNIVIQAENSSTDGRSQETEWNLLKQLAIKGSVIITFFVTIAGAIRDYYIKIGQAEMLQGSTRLYSILIVGVFCSVSYGILWTAADEWVFCWKYGSGGSGKLPSGFSAFILSLSLTLPLALIPPLYENITNKSILPNNHWIAAGAAIIGGVIAHLLMYGIASFGFVGISAQIRPPIGNVGVFRSIFPEAIWALVDFGFIAFTYRIVVSLMSSHKIGIFPLRVLLFSLVFFIGMAAFIIIRYPGSLDDPTWVQVRGFLAGTILPICLSLSMFL